MSSEYAYFKTRMRARGQITIPSEVRRALKADVGDDLIFQIDESGNVWVQLAQMIQPDQTWFWSERWQQMERDVQAELDSGRIHRFANVDEVVSDLESLLDVED